MNGYGRSTRKFSALILFFLMAGVVSLVIIYPLWLFATRTPRGYTIFCGVLFLSGAAAWILFKIRSRKTSAPGLSAGLENQTRSRNLRHRRLKAAGKAILMALSVYLTILLFGSGYFAGGTVFLVAAFLLNGWILYGNKDSRRGR
jgi:hypothetical protein